MFTETITRATHYVKVNKFDNYWDVDISLRTMMNDFSHLFLNARSETKLLHVQCIDTHTKVQNSSMMFPHYFLLENVRAGNLLWSFSTDGQWKYVIHVFMYIPTKFFASLQGTMRISPLFLRVFFIFYSPIKTIQQAKGF